MRRVPRALVSSGSQNEFGVVMQLKTQREGLALSLGGDAVYIRFD